MTKTTHVSMLIELRSHSEPGEYEPYSGLVDGINDSVEIIAHRFSLDLLSVSYNEPTRDLFSQTFSLPPTCTDFQFGLAASTWTMRQAKR